MRKLAILAILALLAVTSANAAQITQTQTYSGIPNLTQNMTFNQFDDNGGAYTLNSIKVILNLNTSGGQLVLDNDSDAPAAGVFEFGAKGNITSPDVTLLNAAFQPITTTAEALNTGVFNLSGNVGDVPNDYDPTPPDGMLHTGVPAFDSQSDFVGSAFWATGTKGYLGTGTYDIALSVNQWLDYGSVGGIEFSATPVSASGDVTVIYDYTIPEPATIALLSVGTLGFIRRRKLA